MARKITKMSADEGDLRQQVIRLSEALTALAAKLDDDGGVTDTNYEALVATKYTVDSTKHTVIPVKI